MPNTIVIPLVYLERKKTPEVRPNMEQPETIVEQQEFESRVVFKVDVAVANPKIKVPFKSTVSYLHAKYIRNLVLSARAKSLYEAGYEIYVTHPLRHFTPVSIEPPYILTESEEFNEYIETTYQTFDNFVVCLVIDTFYTVHSYYLTCKRVISDDMPEFTKIEILSSSPELNIIEGTIDRAYLSYPVRLLPTDFTVTIAHSEGNAYDVTVNASVDGTIDKRILL